MAPDLSLAGARLVIADRAMGLPVLRTLSLCTCRRHYPGAAPERIVSLISSRRISLPRGCRVDLRIVLFEACSAFTRVAACTLALSPIRDTLNRRLQPLRYLHDCSDCFRLERLPGGACTHWKAPPSQRAETIRQLNLSSGESALDIGCGPGYLCESMGELVGRHGAVVGIDISTDLITFCNRRKPSTWLSYAIGDATKIDQADGSFDVVVCTQVAEYVPDVDRALSEAFRVLKPGGRTVFVATDWDAVVWHSENAERMALVMKSWEAHCAHPRLPRSMAYRLVNAGFRFDGATVFPILNLQYDEYVRLITGYSGFRCAEERRFGW